jgi:hypothetical protein
MPVASWAWGAGSTCSLQPSLLSEHLSAHLVATSQLWVQCVLLTQLPPFSFSPFYRDIGHHLPRWSASSNAQVLCAPCIQAPVQSVPSHHGCCSPRESELRPQAPGILEQASLNCHQSPTDPRAKGSLQQVVGRAGMRRPVKLSDTGEVRAQLLSYTTGQKSIPPNDYSCDF